MSTRCARRIRGVPTAAKRFGLRDGGVPIVVSSECQRQVIGGVTTREILVHLVAREGFDAVCRT